MFAALKLFYHNTVRLLFIGSDTIRGWRAGAPAAGIVFLYGECQKRRLNYRAQPYNADSIAAR